MSEVRNSLGSRSVVPILSLLASLFNVAGRDRERLADLRRLSSHLWQENNVRSCALSQRG